MEPVALLQAPGARRGTLAAAQPMAPPPTWPHTTCELPHSGWSAVAMKKSVLPGMMQALPFL